MQRGSGIVAYGRKRPYAAAAALAGAMSLGGVAHSEEASPITTAVEVTVTGKTRPLDEQTHLSVLPTTIQDTPQAVSIIDGAKLKAQGINTLEQALRNVPGITIAIGEGGTLNGDQFKIRGFDSKDDVYVDGLRDFGVYTRDSFNYDQVQVLKGPSGALFGRGTTGGAINTISKRPKLDNFASVDGYVGNGDYYRALADINYQTGPTSAVRLNLMRSDTGVVDRDLVKSDRWGVAASAAVGLGTDTTVVMSYLHQQDHRRPDYGIIVVQRPGEIVARPASEYGVGVERSSFLGFRNDTDRTKADIFTVQFAHKVSDNLTINSDTRVGFYSRYFQYSTLDQCNTACTNALFDGNPATEAFGGIGGSGPYDMDSSGIQNITTFRYDGGFAGFRHQAIFGIDISKQVNDKLFYAYTLPAGITTRPNMPHPIVNPDPNFPAGYTVFRAVPNQNITCPSTGNCTLAGSTTVTSVAGTGVYKSRGVSTDLAAFLTERVWLSDQISVIGSLRLDRYTAELDSVTYAGAASPSGGLKVESNLTSPRVNLLWEPAADRTFYLSWGRSETPQGTSIVGAGTALSVTAKDLEPEESEMLEAGAKFAIPRTPFAATVSAFRIKKDNALQTDAATGFLLAQSGERQEVKGVEIGLVGQLTPAWKLDAAYTYLDSKIKESFSNCAVPASTTGTPTNIVCPVGVTSALPVLNPVAVGRQVAFVPKHAASLYSTYDLGEWVPGLSVGGDVIYQSKLYLTYTARSLSYTDRSTLTAARIGEAPASLTFDAFATYRTGPYSFGVNVYNIGNRLNYTQVSSNRAIPAAGRTVIFSVGATF